MCTIKRRILSEQFFIVYTLLWSLSNAQIQPNNQRGPNPYNQYAQQSQQTIPLKSPLLRSIVSRLEPAQSRDSSVNSASFLNSFIQQLEARRSSNQNFGYKANHLEFQIRDGSWNVVNIRFDDQNNQQQQWNSFIDLLADSLTFIIQEAAKLGYRPNFNYKVELNNAPSGGGGPDLSAQALKSAAG